MYATVREGTANPETMARGKQQVEEFQRIRAQQPGYPGSMTMEAEHGRVLIITLWETPEQGKAAQQKLDPEAWPDLGSLGRSPPCQAPASSRIASWPS